MQNEKLRTGCAMLSLGFSEQQFQSLESYIEAILSFNRTYNLMKADSADELAVGHLLDCLAAVPHLKPILAQKGNDAVAADIGSGGGCPGIPLAIAFPQVPFVLVERMEKRCAFLHDTVARLKLGNVRIQCSAAADIPASSFDLLTFRAFHPFDKKTVPLLTRLAKPKGVIAAYKARSEKIAAEMSEVSRLVPSYTKIPLAVPYLEDHERNLVVIRLP